MAEVGRLLAQKNIEVITEGDIGLEAAAKGAREIGGQATAFLLSGHQANASVAIQEVKLSTSPYSLSPAAEYGLGLGLLLESNRFIILDNGGIKTLAQFLSILAFWENKSKIAILRTHEGFGWWGDELFNQLSQYRCLPPQRKIKIKVTFSPQEAVDWVT